MGSDPRRSYRAFRHSYRASHRSPQSGCSQLPHSFPGTTHPFPILHSPPAPHNPAIPRNPAIPPDCTTPNSASIPPAITATARSNTPTRQSETDYR